MGNKNSTTVESYGYNQETAIESFKAQLQRKYELELFHEERKDGYRRYIVFYGGKKHIVYFDDDENSVWRAFVDFAKNEDL